MSRRSSAPPPTPVEDEEELDFDEEAEYPDMFEALGSLLATDDGETIATALVSTKDAVERIASGIEMQNKILVKMLSALSKMSPPALVSVADETA